MGVTKQGKVIGIKGVESEMERISNIIPFRCLYSKF